MKCVNSVFFILNLMTALIGLAVLVLGVLNLVAHFQNHNVSQFLSSVPIVFIIVGGITVFVSFFGCCGALFNNRCMALTFASLIIIIFVVELLGGIIFYSLYDKEKVTDDLKASLAYYNTDKDIKKFWDLINSDLHCCGVNSSADWEETLPNSCCKDLDINDVCLPEHAFERGCFDVMETYFKQTGPILISVITALQLLSITLALCLGRSYS